MSTAIADTAPEPPDNLTRYQPEGISMASAEVSNVNNTAEFIVHTIRGESVEDLSDLFDQAARAFARVDVTPDALDADLTAVRAECLSATYSEDFLQKLAEAWTATHPTQQAL